MTTNNQLPDAKATDSEIQMFIDSHEKGTAMFLRVESYYLMAKELQERRAADKQPPIAWTDAEELRDLERDGYAAMMSLTREDCEHADPRRQILLFTHPAPLRNAERAELQERRKADATPEFHTAASRFLPECLKAEEISGERRNSRIAELMGWFDRYYRGNANPKWFKPHAAELCYYILTAPPALVVPDDGREQFEAWMLEKWGRERQGYDFVMGKFLHGENYADSYTRHMWKAWSASRAAILNGGKS